MTSGCVLCGGTGEVGEVWQDRDGLIHDEHLRPCPNCETEIELGPEPEETP